jgi:hypothetical protein
LQDHSDEGRSKRSTLPSSWPNSASPGRRECRAEQLATDSCPASSITGRVELVTPFLLRLSLSPGLLRATANLCTADLAGSAVVRAHSGASLRRGFELAAEGCRGAR